MTTTALSRVLCPCANVRRTCKAVVKSSSRVKIDSQRLEATVTMLSSMVDNGLSIEWDTEGWHYAAKNYSGESRKERVALYILALDAINFCFWPSKDGSKPSNSLEYDHLAVALTCLAEEDEKDKDGIGDDFFFSPEKLSSMTPEKMEGSLSKHLQGHYLPNISERCRLWNELGASLLENFEGRATRLLDEADGSATRLVNLLVQSFPGFRDETLYNGQWVALYKRAQIATGDLNAALQLDLKNMDELTTFADYRVPQVLRHWGVLKYDDLLAQTVDAMEELRPNSEEEVSIRAATVLSVDEIALRLGNGMTAVKLDWYIWQIGERMNQGGELNPHHRVRTIFY